jgi:hypothetical protein
MGVTKMEQLQKLKLENAKLQKQISELVTERKSKTHFKASAKSVVSKVKTGDSFIDKEIARKNSAAGFVKYVDGKKVSKCYWALKKAKSKNGKQKWTTMKKSESGKLYHPYKCLFTYNGRKLHTR